MTVQKKTSKDKLVKDIVDVMLGRRGFASDGYLPWGKTILVVDDHGRRKPYTANDNEILSPLTVEGVAAEILRYIDKLDDSTILIDHDLALKIAKTYILRATPIPTPPIVRENHEQGYCLHRYPYHLSEFVEPSEFRSQCPNFANWVDRISRNKEAVVRFIGSLFDPYSYNQQYLVLKGHGGDGKGAFLNCLERFFGPTYAASFTTRMLDKDWTATTYQKRVVAFPDAQNLKFLNYEVFKAITGGNTVQFRNLYEKSFTAVSEAKFIVCTNEEVDVTGMMSDSRRRIFAEISPPERTTPGYQKALYRESPIFFGYCLSQYLTHCEQGMPIETENGVEDYLEANSYDEFESFFDSYLVPHGSMRRSELFRLFKGQVSRFTKDFARFKRYLKKEHGAEEVRMDGKWRLKGVTLRAVNGQAKQW